MKHSAEEPLLSGLRKEPTIQRSLNHGSRSLEDVNKDIKKLDIFRTYYAKRVCQIRLSNMLVLQFDVQCTIYIISKSFTPKLYNM